MSESPAFARTFDLAKETMALVERLPRHRRAVLGRRLEETALALHEAFTRAATLRDPALAALALVDADVALLTHAFALRLVFDAGLVSPGKHAELVRLHAELGRLIGGWQKSLRAR
jgi:hypothetical protein